MGRPFLLFPRRNRFHDVPLCISNKQSHSKLSHRMRHYHLEQQSKDHVISDTERYFCTARVLVPGRLLFSYPGDKSLT
ncbi:hypothetical protein FKM82_006241 [Ascaphus truei]